MFSRLSAYFRALSPSGAFLVFAACGGSPDSVPGNDGGFSATGGQQPSGGGGGQATGGDLSSGGSTSGGTNAGGTNAGGTNAGGTAGSGGTDAGGSSSGGAAAGGRGGLESNQCNSEYACAVGATCYAPGAPVPDICGAPGWCGQCTCPAEPLEPFGLGTRCDDELPCSTQEGAASVCDPEAKTCGTCLSHDDCGQGFCSTDAFAGRSCYECNEDADCPSDRPYCGNGLKRRTCLACRSVADCQEGLCSIEGICTPECTNDSDCSALNTECSLTQLRCVRASCDSDQDCSSQSHCADQSCIPLSCASDDECPPGGYCVAGACFETPGTCRFDLVP